MKRSIFKLLILTIVSLLVFLTKPQITLAVSSGHVHKVTANASTGYYLDSSGQVWAWGTGNYGELGNGTTIDSQSDPVKVLNLSNIISIAGEYSTAYALDSNGHVWAWGAGVDGALGNGTTANSNVPVQVSNLTNIVDIAGGGFRGFALDNNGYVWSWGSRTMEGNLLTPIKLSGLSNIIAIAGGANNGYALDSTGHVWAWGYGYEGGLGNGSNASSDVPVQVSNLSNIVSIAAGAGTAYALDSTGHVWAWGYGAYGQLGNGTYGDINNPVYAYIPVQVSNISNIVTIAGGWYEGYAIDSSHHVWSWGNGPISNSSIPVQFPDLENIVEIAGGYAGIYTIDSSNHVWVLGYNGQKANIINHSVTYDSNGSTAGTVPTDCNVYAPGLTVTVASNTGGLLKAGYTFAGWNTQSDGMGTSYIADGTAIFTIGSGNVVLYAKWVPANHPPTLNDIGTVNGKEGEPISFTITGLDLDNDPLTYSAGNLPEGAKLESTISTKPTTSITSTIAHFIWTPSYTQAGTYTVEFTVNDGNLTDTKAVVIVVANVTPEELVTETIQYVDSLNLEQNAGKSFISKLNSISTYLSNGDKTDAVSQLNAFINQVSAQSDKRKITKEVADTLVSKANLIISVINLE